MKKFALYIYEYEMNDDSEETAPILTHYSDDLAKLIRIAEKFESNALYLESIIHDNTMQRCDESCVYMASEENTNP